MEAYARSGCRQDEPVRPVTSIEFHKELLSIYSPKVFKSVLNFASPQKSRVNAFEYGFGSQ